MGKLGCLMGVALILVRPARAEEKTFAVRTVKDVAYHVGPDQHKIKHKLDLYLPKDHKEFPVLFFVHGGAWVHGDKDMFGLYGMFARNYARLGIGVAVTNYRLSPAVQHPEHIKDVARAFSWCHNNIARYGGKGDRLFACGHSAGAHLVSLLATDESYLKEHKLSSKAICGVVPISGPFIIPPGSMPRVFGTDKELTRKASPISHARKGLPPFLILYADKDLPGCDRKPAEAFSRALKLHKNKVDLVEINNSDHLRIMAGAGTQKDKVFETIVEFIRTHSTK
jgi:acetyl esterase/lipase